jgi:tRNA dimethylallyltransferase
MGPTASGKTDLALHLAQKFNGEIISADSMQIYKGLDIGTAKPSSKERQLVPHHLMDEYEITRKLDVYLFLEEAERAIKEIQARGNIPFIAGGTGFYIHALLYGLDQLPGDEKLRAELDEKYDNPEGFELLKVLMQKKDPQDYERWHMHQRKLIRALEVFELTGKSITELQTLHKPELRYPAAVWNLVWDREELKKRIALRTDIMLKQGWIEEASDAIKRGILDTPTAHQVLGYRVIGEYLDGKISYEFMRERIVTTTWQLARRQITWFRNKHPEAEDINMPVDYRQAELKLKAELNIN